MAQAVKAEEKKDAEFGPEWFETDEYKNLFPKNDPTWINKPLVRLKDNEKKYDGSTIDNFVLPDAKEPHKYFSVVQEAFDTFKKWNKWGVKKEEWVLKVENKDINHSGYIHEFPGSDIPATKEVIILPYNIAVFTGFLGNAAFSKELDPSTDQMMDIETLNYYSGISYVTTKLGIPFVSDRDFLTVDCIYHVGNGEMLILSKSLNDKNFKHPKLKPIKGLVRGTIELSVIHCRPYYEKDLNQTVVTEYSYAKMNGSLPGWVVKQFAACENQKYVREFMDKNKKRLGAPGVLYIPLDVLSFVDLKSLVEFYEKNKEYFKELEEYEQENDNKK